MSTIPITQEEFDTLVNEFLSTQDDSGKDEYYCSERCLAEDVLNKMRTHLFGEEMLKAARHAQYLALKAEFEGENDDGMAIGS